MEQIWQKLLSRRSSKSYVLSVRFTRMLKHFALPMPKIVHSYPDALNVRLRTHPHYDDLIGARFLQACEHILSIPSFLARQ
jgi:hypothetical protein